MKTPLSFCSFLLFSFLLFSFLPSYGQNPNCYRITFSNKNDSPYSVDRPEEFLSPRAIAKRERFNIPVIEQDLPVNPHYIDSILNFSSEPSQIISKSKWDNSVVILYPETENCHAIIDEMLNHFSFVIDTLPVAYYKLPFISDTAKYRTTPVNMQISNAITYCSSSCDYDYGKSIDNIKLHKGELLHKAGFCGEGMLICTFEGSWEGIDTVSYFKPLYENGQILGTRDLVPGVNNVYIGNKDHPLYDYIKWHGAATLSEMACCIEGEFVGTAPKAQYFLIRTENEWGENLVEEDFYAYGTEIADSLGADVVSVSLGYTTFDYEWQNHYTPANNDGVTSIASRAASILAQKGVIVVNAAGNEGSSDWHYIVRPADAFNILAVGAVTNYGLIAYYSSYGPSADGRVKPDVVSPGWGAWVIKENITQAGGTSSATPIIAGLSACLWQALPQYTSLEIMDLIRKYGNRYNNPHNKYGYGIPDFYQCYLDQTYGVAENIKPEVLVYPNPTTGELRVEISDMRYEISDIEIYDLYGRKYLVSSLTSQVSNHLIVSSSNHLINIAHLAAGIYFLKITTEAGMITKKIIKY